MWELENLPDAQADAVGGRAGHADEDGVVEPVVRAVLRRFELRRRAEIEARRPLFVTTRRDQSAVADMDMDYPMIVSELSILMGAGMSFRKALERIVFKYTNNVRAGKTEMRPGFEQMVITYRRMSDGLSEIQAIEELGMKCESKNYRKLSMLLSQNLRKGSKDLIDCLEKEQQNAFELRKQRAIRAGEEASTKLLIPMAGMLFIVIVILVVLAVLQINI